jgi:hypothetical protein
MPVAHKGEWRPKQRRRASKTTKAANKSTTTKAAPGANSEK